MPPDGFFPTIGAPSQPDYNDYPQDFGRTVDRLACRKSIFSGGALAGAFGRSGLGIAWRRAFLGCALALLTGCQALFNPSASLDELAYSRAQPVASQLDEPPAYQVPLPNEPALSEEEALAGVLEELQAIGAIDPDAQRQLMENLRDAKPEHYELIVEQYRTALAFRNQLAAREAASATTDQLANGTQEPAGERAPTTRREVAPPGPARRLHAEVVDGPPAARSLEPAPTEVAGNVRRLPTPPQQTIETVSHVSDRPPVEVAAPAGGGNWQEQLDDAIAELDASLVSQPRTTAELHAHFRLRALELFAGRPDDALRPIPGATPAQQDYWAKQLYALSAFLDEQTHGDDRKRAAAALVYLDQARDQLSELAVLEIRNLAFVQSVNGFGEYAMREETKFGPGEQVTLYAEVENFRSESTAEGYRTRLGTSYQIIDQAGNRVDHGQFPDVEDLCQSRRRDFHMQYGIVLPTRIYAGQYSLELIVTDGQSKKIAQQRLPLEIVESGGSSQPR